MRRSECFEFTDWVLENYRKVGDVGYLKKGERISERANILRMEDLYEIWVTY